MSSRRFDEDQRRHQSILRQAYPASATHQDKSTNHFTQSLDHDTKASIESDIGEHSSVYFLASRISQQFQVKLPIPKHPIPHYVSSIVGDNSQRLAVATTFFETIHKWVPIVSKKRFYENVNPLCLLRPDYALLLMCMDLLSWLPESHIHNARIPLYLSIKRYQLDLDISGFLSIQALQASVFIAIFELGHAIYPSAFLSVATCARYGSALGLGWNPTRPREDSYSWIDAEEQNRVWWAIVLLDR